MKQDPNSLSGPRRTPLDIPLRNARGFPPAPDAHSALAGTHTNNPESPIQKSAPESTARPSAPPCPVSSVSPAASASHSPLEYTHAALLADDSSWHAILAASPPTIG